LGIAALDGAARSRLRSTAPQSGIITTAGIA
jgi:hypothetical protein